MNEKVYCEKCDHHYFYGFTSLTHHCFCPSIKYDTPIRVREGGNCETLNKGNDCPYFQAIAINSPKPKEKSWFKRIFSW